ERPWISDLTGTWITPEQATDPAYWGRHLRGTVRFAEGLGTLLEDPSRLFLEVGPGSSLTRLVRRHPACGREREVVASLPESGETEGRGLLSALGKLWAAGVEVSWKAVHGRGRRRVPLPPYPFERQRYWIDPVAAAAAAPGERGKEPEIADWFFLPSWRRSLPPPLPQPPRPKGAGSSSWTAARAWESGWLAGSASSERPWCGWFPENVSAATAKGSTRSIPARARATSTCWRACARPA